MEKKSFRNLISFRGVINGKAADLLKFSDTKTLFQSWGILRLITLGQTMLNLSSIEFIQVRKCQNENMKSLHCPKYE